MSSQAIPCQDSAFIDRLGRWIDLVSKPETEHNDRYSLESHAHPGRRRRTRRRAAWWRRWERTTGMRAAPQHWRCGRWCRRWGRASTLGRCVTRRFACSAPASREGGMGPSVECGVRQNARCGSNLAACVTGPAHCSVLRSVFGWINLRYMATLSLQQCFDPPGCIAYTCSLSHAL